MDICPSNYINEISARESDIGNILVEVTYFSSQDSLTYDTRSLCLMLMIPSRSAVPEL
jgi:hypothetical protein